MTKYGQRKETPRELRPNVLRDYDADDSYLDSPEFYAYCKQVRGVLRMKRSMTIGDIRRAMGEAFDDRHILDALASLIGDGDIERLWGALPSRYVRIKRKARQNVDIRDCLGPGRPSNKTTPSVDSFSFGRNVIA